MEKYYIRSNKYSTHERQTKHGRVYDIVFRIVTIDGEEKQKRISGFKTKADAKAGYLEFVEKFCELTRYVPKKPKELTAQFNPTVAELVPTYIAALGNQNKGSSIYDKHNNLTHYIIPQLGDVRIKDLTKERLYQWQDELWSMKNPRTGDFYSHQYLSKLRNILSAFLSWVSDRYGFVNHLPNVKKPKRRTPKTEMLFWTREEFDTFITVVDNPTYRAMYCMLFFTGRRKGEVLALSPADITEKGIRFNKTYTRKTIDGQPYNITSTMKENHHIWWLFIIEKPPYIVFLYTRYKTGTGNKKTADYSRKQPAFVFGNVSHSSRICSPSPFPSPSFGTFTHSLNKDRNERRQRMTRFLVTAIWL